MAVESKTQLKTYFKTGDKPNQSQFTNLIDSYADFAKGALADTALQPAAVGVSVQGYTAALNGTTASFTTAKDTKLTGVTTGANIVQVDHGSTAGTARPAGAARVMWVGSVSPTNAQTNDTWINTA